MCMLFNHMVVMPNCKEVCNVILLNHIMMKTLHLNINMDVIVYHPWSGGEHQNAWDTEQVAAVQPKTQKPKSPKSKTWTKNLKQSKHKSGPKTSLENLTRKPKTTPTTKKPIKYPNHPSEKNK